MKLPQVNFRTTFLSVCIMEKATDSFVGIVLNVFTALGRIKIFIILLLLIQEYGYYFQQICSSFFSLQCSVVFIVDASHIPG